jgi:glycosyltransferase involved in cell wall biosynthesis
MSGGDRHGLEVWKSWYKRRLAEIEVVCPVQGRELCEHFGYALPVYQSEVRRSVVGANRLGYLVRLAGALAAVFGLPSSDVAYASSPYFYDLIPAVVLKYSKRGRKLICPVFHIIPSPAQREGSYLMNAIAWFEQRAMIALLSVTADCVITDNADVARSLVARGVTRSRIVVSKMGVTARPPVDPRSMTRSMVVVSVGRLSAAKGVGTLLQAWRLVLENHPGATLVLVGNSSPDFDVSAEVQQLGLEASVTVMQGLSDEEVQSILSTSRFFVTASREEGYGLAVQEALARGLPCVTFDLPAFAHAFPQGRVVARDFDPATLANAIGSLFSDENLLQLRAQVEQNTFYTWDEVADDILRALEKTAS